MISPNTNSKKFKDLLFAPVLAILYLTVFMLLPLMILSDTMEGEE